MDEFKIDINTLKSEEFDLVQDYKSNLIESFHKKRLSNITKLDKILRLYLEEIKSIDVDELIKFKDKARDTHICSFLQNLRMISYINGQTDEYRDGSNLIVIVDRITQEIIEKGQWYRFIGL